MIKYDPADNERIKKEKLEQKALEAGYRAIRNHPAYISGGFTIRKKIWKGFNQTVRDLNK